MSTTRILPPEEWDQIAPVFTEHGGALPNPALARIVVAEDAGAVVGFLVVQLVPHLEPIWVAPEYRGRLNWTALVKTAEEQLPTGTTVYAFAPTNTIERMATHVGMSQLPWSVYSKQTQDKQ